MVQAQTFYVQVLRGSFLFVVNVTNEKLTETTGSIEFCQVPLELKIRSCYNLSTWLVYAKINTHVLFLLYTNIVP